MPGGWRRRYPCGRRRRCRARCPGTDGGDRWRGGRTRPPGDPGGTVFPRCRHFCSATPVVGRKAARTGRLGRPRCGCVHRGPWPGDPGGTIFPRCRYFRSATPVACAGGKVYAGLQGAGGMQDALAGGAGSLFFALVPSGCGRPAPDKALGGEVGILHPLPGATDVAERLFLCKWSIVVPPGPPGHLGGAALHVER